LFIRGVYIHFAFLKIEAYLTKLSITQLIL